MKDDTALKVNAYMDVWKLKTLDFIPASNFLVVKENFSSPTDLF